MRPARAALALALLADVFVTWCAGVESVNDGDSSSVSPTDDADDEGDSAPFMVVVRHADGRACGAALVSLRTALSSAECARGAAELWAVAPAAAAAARRVVRVALAAGGDGPAAAVAGDPWAGADADLALLELAAPLPGALSILMATDPGDCEPPQGCHLVRLVRGLGPVSRLRIVDARLEAGGACAARGPRWAALRARTLCLTGPELCPEDRGTGVVCRGKLCGVVSRSAGDSAAGDRCGDAHAAASVPRWRRFLHCAHTRGACGRDGDCAQLCSEHWLVDSPPEAGTSALATEPTGHGHAHTAPATSPAGHARMHTPSPAKAAASRRAPMADALRLGGEVTAAPPRTPRVLPAGEGKAEGAPPRTEPVSAAAGTTSGAAGATPATTGAAISSTVDAAPAGCSPRGAFEFEPNRADFRMSAASTRVFLKAGEYGDNAAEYAAPEDAGGGAAAGPAPASAAPSTPSRTPGTGALAAGSGPASPVPAAAAGSHPRAPPRTPDAQMIAGRAAGMRPILATFVLFIVFMVFCTK